MVKKYIKINGVEKEINVYTEEESDVLENSHLDDTLDLSTEFEKFGVDYE